MTDPARFDDVAIFALAERAELRDAATRGHLSRVSAISGILAAELQAAGAHPIVDDAFIGLIEETSVLHDIGKHAILDRVLLKPGRLGDDEMGQMRTHALLGAKTLRSLSGRSPHDPWLIMATQVALTHHERWDGTGYPRGLRGEAIPLAGRIVAVADVYDALTSRRVYKLAIEHEQACKMIADGSGTHFDPSIAAAFARCAKSIGAGDAMRPALRLAA